MIQEYIENKISLKCHENVDNTEPLKIGNGANLFASIAGAQCRDTQQEPIDLTHLEILHDIDTREIWPNHLASTVSTPGPFNLTPNRQNSDNRRDDEGPLDILDDNDTNFANFRLKQLQPQNESQICHFIEDNLDSDDNDNDIVYQLEIDELYYDTLADEISSFIEVKCKCGNDNIEGTR